MRFSGAPARTRTADLLITNQLLYQLSYKGIEGFGMRQHTAKYADFFVRIKINKNVESLNISNSAAIVFHHLSNSKKNLD